MTYKTINAQVPLLHLGLALLIAISTCTLTSAATADGDPGWSVDSLASSLHFISTKAGHIAEVHQFGQLSGSVDQAGLAKLDISLGSVATGIDIRNERMQSMLFDVASFPIATFTTEVDTAPMLAMEAGDQLEVALTGTLDLVGTQASLDADLVVTRIAADVFQLTTKAPIIINADRWRLVSGIESLRAIAGLPSISHAVPVTLSLRIKASS